VHRLCHSEHVLRRNIGLDIVHCSSNITPSRREIADTPAHFFLYIRWTAVR
jgi:hypothetical protein